MIDQANGQMILDDLAVILGNFHGREYSGRIDADTMFFADLGLASIDAVVLGEMLETKYGRKLPFGDLPGGMYLGLATNDVFAHGWDLAKATGQSTDLDPAMAAQLLAGMEMGLPDEIRGPFGPMRTNVPGIEVCEHLPRHAKIAHRFSLIRSLCHDEAGHFEGHRRLLSGFGKSKQGSHESYYPQVGAVVKRIHPAGTSGLPSALSVGGVVVNNPDFDHVPSSLKVFDCPHYSRNSRQQV